MSETESAEVRRIYGVCDRLHDAVELFAEVEVDLNAVIGAYYGQTAELVHLRAVAEAARVFHAKGPDYWDDGHGDPEWSALGAALSALDGSGG